MQKAQGFRRQANASERAFWAIVRDEQLGFKFRRQHAIDTFVLDFYCPEAALCIEVDGEVHELRRGRDEARDQLLLERGIQTIRIPTLELFERNSSVVSKWIDQVVVLCEERSGRKAWQKWKP